MCPAVVLAGFPCVQDCGRAHDAPTALGVCLRTYGASFVVVLATCAVLLAVAGAQWLGVMCWWVFLQYE